MSVHNNDKEQDKHPHVAQQVMCLPEITVKFVRKRISSHHSGLVYINVNSTVCAQTMHPVGVMCQFMWNLHFFKTFHTRIGIEGILRYELKELLSSNSANWQNKRFTTDSFGFIDTKI